MNKLQLLQVARFLTVGVGAATVHFTIVVLLVQLLNYAPLIANVGGFVVSFQVSYWGHRLWTFSETDVSHREAYPKLVMVQVLNFCMNEYLFYFFLSYNLPYPLALLIVLSILPAFTFVMNKFWVFQS
ncbi:MAG TPA: GtrA family protein [Gammaproteobacteria bacterium]|jgi:putative flippase GtrA|nr:GtrA family protein [Gammaproteobacteria bacterium]